MQIPKSDVLAQVPSGGIIISGATFGPETIKDMTTALERIRTVLRLEDSDDPLVEVIAKKVISLASQGTFDPKEIERLVIADTKRP